MESHLWVKKSGFVGGVGRCAESLCWDSALGVWHSLVSRVKGTLMELEVLGKNQ